MSAQLQTQAKVSLIPKPSMASMQTQILQRKCACGGTPGVDGECGECRSKRLSSQRQAIPMTLQTKLTVNKPGDQYELEADRVAEQVVRMPVPEATVRAETSRELQSLPIRRLHLEGG